MTYLQLINNVLVRLRENTITETQVNSNPYYASIGAHVNDAKDRVQDAWEWSQLRASRDVTAFATNPVVTLTGTTNNQFQINSILVQDEKTYLRNTSIPWLKDKYRTRPVAEPTGQPIYYAITGAQLTPQTAINAGPNVSNDLEMTVYPIPDKNYILSVEGVYHQEALVNANDYLLVPSLPVYTLATALASRERGEVGGTPTSELFAIADRHLSDAIAIDSSRFENEMDWYSAGQQWHNTNVRS